MTLRNVLPDWSIRLLVLCLLLPALLAALDSFFRARRRRLRTGAWLAWALAAGAAVPLAWAWLRRARDRRRAARAARPGRRPPTCGSTRARRRRSPRSRSPLAGALLLVRPLTRSARAERGSPAAGAAGAAVGAIVCAVTLARLGRRTRTPPRCCCRPRTCGCSSASPQTRLRGRIAWLALAAGLLAPLLVLVYELRALRAGPLELARMWLVATAGGHVSAWSALAVGALAGCVATLVRILRARRRIAAAAPRRAADARAARRATPGPGSLGGTESALRR